VQPIRVIIASESAIDAVVALADTGKYVSVDVRNIDTEVAENSEDGNDENDTSGVRLYQSVYETALRNRIPRPIIEDLIRIYSYDVDFQRKVQPGDSFEVLYAGEEETPAADSRNDVLFAALTVGGEMKKFYRFQSPDDGLVDYYDETGKSAKKFLVRKPVLAGIMRSGFGLRRHPILGYTKMHTGVDWAAPGGTPIYASGNGTVEKVGWESGYGKYVRVRHTNGYETAVRPYDRLRARHRRRHARAAGPGDRLCRLDRPLDRLAPALRDFGQRPLRRSDANQAPARPCPRRPDARGLRKGTRAARWHHGPQAGTRCLEWSGGTLNALRCLRELAVERQPQLVAGDIDFLAVLDLPGKDHLGKRILHRFLDHALERTCSIGRVPAFFGQPVACARIELDGDLAIVEQLLQPCHLNVDDAAHLAFFSRWNRMISSTRLRNSGRNAARTTAMT
jgi:murein DD-endopeptidase MepM/ murein hydrolase activator NlpD